MAIQPPHLFEPLDPSFETRVRDSFARQTAMRTLGITIHRIAPGEIELRMPYASNYTQQHGYMHAGTMTTALDSACGYAAFTLMPANAEVLTVEFKTNCWRRPRVKVSGSRLPSSSRVARSPSARRALTPSTMARTGWSLP